MPSQDVLLFIQMSPPRACVRAVGELDVRTSERLARRLATAVEAGCRDFLLDLGGVTFFDASAVGVLVRLRREAVRTGGSVTVAAVSPSVRHVLSLVGLTETFHLPTEPSGRLASAEQDR